MMIFMRTIDLILLGILLALEEAIVSNKITTDDEEND